MIIFRNFSEKYELRAILDADLDAQRDFAPQCISQKQNSSISEVWHFWLIAFSFFVASNAVFYDYLVFVHILGTTK